jgi:hypothetical protein
VRLCVPQICSIGEEGGLSTHLEEHSIHCAVLRTLSGNGLSVDAQLTTVANVLEEWLETPLAFPALGPAPSQYYIKWVQAWLALLRYLQAPVVSHCQHGSGSSSRRAAQL